MLLSCHIAATLLDEFYTFYLERDLERDADRDFDGDLSRAASRPSDSSFVFDPLLDRRLGDLLPPLSLSFDSGLVREPLRLAVREPERSLRDLDRVRDRDFDLLRRSREPERRLPERDPDRERRRREREPDLRDLLERCGEFGRPYLAI